MTTTFTKSIRVDLVDPGCVAIRARQGLPTPCDGKVAAPLRCVARSPWPPGGGR